MAAGINYNNVWSSLGKPVDVIGMRQRQGEPEDFHIGGSEASGVVWAVGEGVRHVKVGDHVLLTSGIVAWFTVPGKSAGDRVHRRDSETQRG